MRRTKASTGHQVGEPERPRPTRSPRTWFFWVVNSSWTWVVACKSVAGQVWSDSARLPTKQYTSHMRNAVEASADVERAYSPGLSRKKKPRMSMSAMAAWRAVLAA